MPANHPVVIPACVIIAIPKRNSIGTSQGVT